MSASHERSLLIAADTVQYAAAAGTPTTVDTGSITDLAPGSLAFVDADTNTVIPATTPAATDWDDVKKFYIAVGMADGSVKLSTAIDRRGVMRWDVQSYVAGLPQIQTVTPTLASPQAPGDIYELTIVDGSDPNFLPENRETFNVVDQTGSLTVATLIDAFVLAINDTATGSEIVTATDNTTTLGLTHKTAGATFFIALRENLEGDVKAQTQAAVAPSGSGAQVAALEQDINVYDGNTNRVWLPSYYFSQAAAVDTAETYDIYAYEGVNPYQRKDGMDAQYGRQISVLVAMPAAATQQANFEAQATFAFGPFAGAPESGDDAG